MFIVQLIEATYNFLWGDLFQIPLPVGGSIGISLLILFLVPAAVYFTIRTRFMQVRLFPDMVQALVEKKQKKQSVFISDTDRFDGNPCRYGKSGRCCCGNFGRRRRCGFLDVGDGNYRFINSFY